MLRASTTQEAIGLAHDDNAAKILAEGSQELELEMTDAWLDDYVTVVICYCSLFLLLLHEQDDGCLLVVAKQWRTHIFEYSINLHWSNQKW